MLVDTICQYVHVPIHFTVMKGEDSSRTWKMHAQEGSLYRNMTEQLCIVAMEGWTVMVQGCGTLTQVRCAEVCGDRHSS